MHAYKASRWDTIFFFLLVFYRAYQDGVYLGMMPCVCYGMHIIAGVAICVLLALMIPPLYVAIDATKYRQ